MDDRHVLLGLFEKFQKLNVLVVGDVMVDDYIHGHVRRISPEAPIPIVDVSRKETCLGGAANVALNIQALGATAHLFSIVGTDAHGETLLRLMKDCGLWTDGIIQSSHRRTTVKTRVISGSQHLVRFDEEDTHRLNELEENQLLAKIKDNLRSYDVVVFEDYDKGCLNREVISNIINSASALDIPTAVDPKKNNFMDYIGATLFKPNLKELNEGLGRNVSLENLNVAIDALATHLKFREILVTLSEKGVFFRDKHENGIIPAHLRNIANVSGAGDTVIAVAALCLASGAKIRDTAQLANLAGGIVCESPGIVPIEKEKLLSEMRDSAT